MVEIWKPVIGFEGLYEVSNMGRVKGYNSKILKPYESKDGYLQVSLYKDMKASKRYVHRLVASAFCLKPEFQCEVNHIDENKKNNCSENLEWVTHRKNIIHGSRIEKQRNTLLSNGKLQKRVACLSIDGELIQTFESIKKASELTGANQSSISQCCKEAQHYRTAGGYKWQYT